jgi:hypothetical protein
VAISVVWKNHLGDWKTAPEPAVHLLAVAVRPYSRENRSVRLMFFRASKPKFSGTNQRAMSQCARAMDETSEWKNIEDEVSGNKYTAQSPEL